MPRGQYVRKPRTDKAASDVSVTVSVVNDRDTLARETAEANQAAAEAIDDQRVPTANVAPAIGTATAEVAGRTMTQVYADVAALDDLELVRVAETLTAQARHDAEVARNMAQTAAFGSWSEPDNVRFAAKPDRFDDWMAEDIKPLPANDHVSLIVQDWFASIIPGEHSVTWLSVDDGRSLQVLLTTPHGTTSLKGDAGLWDEPSIMRALVGMRVELGV